MKQFSTALFVSVMFVSAALAFGLAGCGATTSDEGTANENLDADASTGGPSTGSSDDDPVSGNNGSNDPGGNGANGGAPDPNGGGERDAGSVPGDPGSAGPRQDAGAAEPGAGGADAGQPPLTCPDKADPSVTYVSADPVVCSQKRRICEAGQKEFRIDGCGCGCISEKPVCPDPNDPGVSYVSESPKECQVVKFACEKGQELFSNECGCGCLTPAAPVCEPKPNEQYIGTSPEQCERIKFACTDGSKPFSNACGCGCVFPDDGSICKLPVDPGPCRGAIPRFYFNARRGCVSFTYGGCQGNPNNFETKAECQKACGGPISVP